MNFGGLYGAVDGDAGVNFGGLLGVVGENAGVNVSLVYADVGGSQDYTIEDVLPRLTRYLPKFIREISFPAINFGTVTNTKNPRNSFALGVYNRVDATNGKDYISVGLLNRVITPEGHGKKRVSYIPFLAGKVSIDGIFRHRKQTQENKDDTKQRHNK